MFENRGKEIGVTLHHPHGQIYAYPYVTPRTTAMLAQARAHHERTGRLLGRDVLDAERRTASGSSSSREHWVAYVPAAARWPVEVHLAPHRDVPDLPALADAERDELSTRLPGAAAAAGPVLRRPDGEADPAAVHRRLAPGARRARAATSPACTCSCSRCCARRAS